MQGSTRIAVIACEVFRAELEFLIEKLRLSHDVHFLPQGLHDVPNKLREQLQLKINELENSSPAPTKILLCYGYCGQGLSGISSQKTPLVLPRVHDCIPLLLGLNQEQKSQIPDSERTFWMSPGWLRYSQLPFVENRQKRFQEYADKFGEDSAQYLIDMEHGWLKEYSQARLILWDQWKDSEQLYKTARFVADDAGLKLTTMSGSMSYVQALLMGAAQPDLFFQIPPQHTLELSASGVFTASPLSKKAV
ncbi:DUF1638 domain-containing protein [Desulfobaculum bizertense]|uniref:DUF1638 domain-containing protein n=1 Tax=Desulfobaculum bizertense DSM 18034 TaxID=1121442 RepID=A0A1T4VPI4_9BACT|nr:DUF1638 domain-containing protein [Desulfobaculum bizertense]UIJ38216.1 DUF1638 domain-containing protein [Desulfobaculum bizertense]SKA66837.1 Protein of unknown function [Desulfobaculum bizertense DSM 18034]